MKSTSSEQSTLSHANFILSVLAVLASVLAVYIAWDSARTSAGLASQANDLSERALEIQVAARLTPVDVQFVFNAAGHPVSVRATTERPDMTHSLAVRQFLTFASGISGCAEIDEAFPDFYEADIRGPNFKERPRSSTASEIEMVLDPLATRTLVGMDVPDEYEDCWFTILWTVAKVVQTDVTGTSIDRYFVYEGNAKQGFASFRPSNSEGWDQLFDGWYRLPTWYCNDTDDDYCSPAADDPGNTCNRVSSRSATMGMIPRWRCLLVTCYLRRGVGQDQGGFSNHK